MSLPPPPPRPKFITGLGWTFLILSCWSTFLTLLMFVALELISRFSGGHPLELAAKQADQQGIPPTIGLLMRYTGIEMALTIPAGLFTALAAHRLLQMREWARRAFLWILSVMILVTLVKLSLSFVVPFLMLNQVSSGGGGWSPNGFVLVVAGLSLLQVLMLLALLGWCFYRLRQPEIRRGFVPGL